VSSASAAKGSGLTMNGHDLDSDDIRERVRAEERQRLSLELHDTVGQILVLTKLQLARMQQALNQPLDATTRTWLQGILTSLIPEIDNALQMVQTATFTLYAAGLTEVGLVATLEKECTTFTHRTGIRCEGRFEPLSLDAEGGELVVFIFREALSNIARHSSATNARATLQRSGERAVLTIRDNGTGIDRSHTKAAEDIGLRGMEERAKTLGGELTIDSTPNKGTEIRVSFPLPHPRGHSHPQENTPLPD
jgi:signal transduction histidine kinase